VQNVAAFKPPVRLLMGPGPGHEVVIGVNGVFGGRMADVAEHAKNNPAVSSK
jgi:aspartate aminotransferase-like enzyme